MAETAEGEKRENGEQKAASGRDAFGKGREVSHVRWPYVKGYLSPIVNARPERFPFFVKFRGVFTLAVGDVGIVLSIAKVQLNPCNKKACHLWRL